MFLFILKVSISSVYWIGNRILINKFNDWMYWIFLSLKKYINIQINIQIIVWNVILKKSKKKNNFHYNVQKLSSTFIMYNRTIFI